MFEKFKGKKQIYIIFMYLNVYISLKYDLNYI